MQLERDNEKATTPAPLLSVVTVVRNDAWALVRTIRSVLEQTARGFEYVVVDGASTDGTRNLIAFWRDQGLIDRASSEPDTGVYNAMNKAARLARGDFVCFLNAGDVFAAPDVLDRVQRALEGGALDGLLGWGELDGQIWASWTESEAFLLASLGFCHQALFLRRALLLEEPFDERSFKTDSDTRQLGRLIARGHRIAILPEVLAVRGGGPGISADLARTAASICNTLEEEYPGLTTDDAGRIIAFRRRCTDPPAMLRLMAGADPRLARHVARMVLDTLFLRQSAALDTATAALLREAATGVLAAEDEPSGGPTDLRRLAAAQRQRSRLLEARRTDGAARNCALAAFAQDEERRIADARAEVLAAAAPPRDDIVVSMTSFPARLGTVAFAVRSLFEQTCPPVEIHLWLGRDEVPGPAWLPRRLRDLEPRGLRVHFADRTCHQYDKFLHNAALNADRPFVIADDDVIYPPRALEHLLAGHALHPGCVVANRCNLMALRPDGSAAPYLTWAREQRMPAPHPLLFPTGAGGVLFPPGFLNDPMVTDTARILRLAPCADDIWLKACALVRGIPAFATALSHRADWYCRYTPDMASGTLMAANLDRGLNDAQIAACLQWVVSLRPDWQAGLAALAE